MKLEHFDVDTAGGTVEVRMRSGKVNALSPSMVTEGHFILQELTDDASVRSMILTGGDSRFFSFGFDVASLLELDRPEMREFLVGFNRLAEEFYQFPRPVVAAVNGHAMGGGMILALAADHRVAARGEFSLGLPETRLGVAVPPSALRILVRRVGHARAAALALDGSPLSPDAALELGLVEETVDPPKLMDRARERAHRMADVPLAAFAANKAYLTEGVVLEDSRDENEAWLDLWFEPRGQELLRALVERR